VERENKCTVNLQPVDVRVSKNFVREESCCIINYYYIWVGLIDRLDLIVYIASTELYISYVLRCLETNVSTIPLAPTPSILNTSYNLDRRK
jgi:hypothetical protein